MSMISELIEELIDNADLYTKELHDLMYRAAETIEMLSEKAREPKRGEWIGEGNGYADGGIVYDTWYCSNCDHCEEGEELALPNFCPNCGARMNSSKKPNNCEDEPQNAYERGRQDALNELMEYTYGMLTAEKFGLQHKIKSMMSDRKTEPQLKGSKRLLKGKTEPQTEETEIERLERIDNEIEDAWTRIRELTDEPQTGLCRDCKDYAGNGMFCAKNYMVYDFSRSVCKTEPQERSE